MSLTQVTKYLDDKYPEIEYFQKSDEDLDFIEVLNRNAEIGSLKIFYYYDEFTLEIGNHTHFHEGDMEGVSFSLDCLFHDRMVFYSAIEGKTGGCYYFYDDEIKVENYNPKKNKYFTWSGKYHQ